MPFKDKRIKVSPVSKIQSRKFGKQEHYGDNWGNLSKSIREMSSYICSVCKKGFMMKKNQLQVDHIVAISKGGSNSFTNLRPLCIECHKKKTLL